MLKIRKIDIMSWAKITAFIFGMMGLIMGLVITILGLFGIFPEAGPHIKPVTFMRSFAFVTFTIFYGVLGFIIGVVTAFLFNLATEWVGSLKVKIDSDA